MWLSLLEFVASDAYAAWKLHGNEEDECTFMKKLSCELLENAKGVVCDEVWGVGGKRKRGSGTDLWGAGAYEEEANSYPHIVRSLNELKDLSGPSDNRLRCMFCGKKCRLYCTKCSQPEKKSIKAFCCASKGCDCMIKHLYE